MKISMKDLKAIGENLDKCQPPKLADDIAQDMSLKQIITNLAPKLLRMKRQGFTTDGIVSALKENKISIDGKTLNRYLNDYKVNRKGTGSDATAKPKLAKPADGKDSLTPKEETPSRQSSSPVTAPPAPAEKFLTPEKNTPSGQPGHPFSTKVDSIPPHLKDLI